MTEFEKVVSELFGLCSGDSELLPVFSKVLAESLMISKAYDDRISGNKQVKL